MLDDDLYVFFGTCVLWVLWICDPDVDPFD